MTLSIGKHEIEAQIKSPMGWVKIIADLTIESDTVFSGQAKLLGCSVDLTDCRKDGDHVSFAASPRLPFGVLHVDIEADFASDGSISGIANAPRHKPMEIRGQLLH
jgi:hypothetical protein